MGDFERRVNAPDPLNEYNDLCHSNAWRIAEWVEQRGLDRSAIDDWMLGYATDGKLVGRVTVPVRHPWSGFLVSITGRSIGFADPKYLHISFEASRCLFGKPRRERLPYVILCEGHFDVIFLEQFGFYAYASMGSSPLSMFQLGLLKRWTSKVVVYGDTGKAGEKATGKWCESLSKFGFKIAKGGYVGGATDPEELAKIRPDFIQRMVDSIT